MTVLFTDLRVLGAQELQRLAALIDGTYTMPKSAGGAVTASAGMTLSVAAISKGIAFVNGVRDTTGYAGGTTTISTADATNPRRDWVWYDGAGAIGNTAGTAAANPVLPDLTAGRIGLAAIYVAANDTTISGASEIEDRRASSMTDIVKRTTATQTVSASTTLVDMIATASDVFSCPMLAGEAWLLEADIPITVTGTGGAKFQFSTTSAVTAISARIIYPSIVDTSNERAMLWDAAVTATASDIGAHNAAATTQNLYSTGANGGTVRIYAYVVANLATLVTLQIAQNSANGTTIAGIGSTWRASRITP